MTIDVDPENARDILKFVDTIVPEGGQSVWLCGSRARGDARPNSDWDVVAFSQYAPSDPSELFKSNQIGYFRGGKIELVIAHPNHWTDSRPYMVDCRRFGLRLR